MKRAYCDIREKPEYRADAFIAGLKTSGFHVLPRQLPAEPPRADDVLVIWNRYSDRELTADKWEKHGGAVLVCENGYVGRDAEGRQLYAISLHGHNGSGTWPAGGPERWESLGITLKPWRADGEHILVCPNRHFGMRGLAMPQYWEQETVRALRKVTKRPIRVRPHPNGNPPAKPLTEDLERCFAVVIWASSAGVHALVEGVPVFCGAPWWICRQAACLDVSTIENPAFPEREPAFVRLAWAQWTLDEITSGEAFRLLLSDTRQEKVAAAV